MYRSSHAVSSFILVNSVPFGGGVVVVYCSEKQGLIRRYIINTFFYIFLPLTVSYRRYIINRFFLIRQQYHIPSKLPHIALVNRSAVFLPSKLFTGLYGAIRGLYGHLRFMPCVGFTKLPIITIVLMPFCEIHNEK